MDLRKRVERLEDARPAVNGLTEDEKRLLYEYDQAGSDHPEYDMMLHLQLYRKSRPGLTFEQLLAETLLSNKEAI